MRLLDQLRIRQVIALIVIAPVLVGVIATSMLAKAAQDRRDEAYAELADLEILLAVRDVESAGSGEVALYSGWTLAQLETDFESRDVMVSVAKDALTQVSVEGTDAAFARAREATLPAEVSESVDALEASVHAARDAFSVADVDALATAALETDLHRATLDSTAAEVVRRRGLQWSTIDLQSIVAARLEDEVVGVATMLLVGFPDEAERMRAVVLIDRTDQAMAEMVDSENSDAVREFEQAFHDTSYYQDVRERALDADLQAPLSVTTLLIAASDITPFLEQVRNTWFESADELEAEATARANHASHERTLMIAIAATLVMVSTGLVLTIGGRLSRRVGQLADAAERISNGELGVRIEEIGGSDELALLATAFNEVSATVAVSHAQISALADGRNDDPVFETELPGMVGHTLRLALRRLGNATAELTHQASHDKLTGLLDRRGLQFGLDAAGDGTRWSVVLVDLDGFKQVNDCWGHSAGDAVLVATANRLLATVRSADLVARLGGDEFVLVVDGTTDTSVEKTIERVVTEIAKDVEWGRELLRVTCSIGWTQLADDETFGDALQRADRALYDVKRNGKAHALQA